MDGKQSSKTRRVRRSGEANRLEDEVLAAAYEQIWPVLLKVLNETSSSSHKKLQAAPDAAAIVARSA